MANVPTQRAGGGSQRQLNARRQFAAALVHSAKPAIMAHARGSVAPIPLVTPTIVRTTQCDAWWPHST